MRARIDIGASVKGVEAERPGFFHSIVIAVLRSGPAGVRERAILTPLEPK